MCFPYILYHGRVTNWCDIFDRLQAQNRMKLLFTTKSSLLGLFFTNFFFHVCGPKRQKTKEFAIQYWQFSLQTSLSSFTCTELLHLPLFGAFCSQHFLEEKVLMTQPKTTKSWVSNSTQPTLLEIINHGFQILLNQDSKK